MKRGVLYASGTYHSTSTGDYELRLAHLVVKDKHIYNKALYGRVLPCNLLPSINKTLYVMYNTSQAKS
jgi:hypothetical protein